MVVVVVFTPSTTLNAAHFTLLVAFETAHREPSKVFSAAHFTLFAVLIVVSLTFMRCIVTKNRIKAAFAALIVVSLTSRGSPSRLRVRVRVRGSK